MGCAFSYSRQGRCYVKFVFNYAIKNHIMKILIAHAEQWIQPHASVNKKIIKKKKL